MKKEKTLEIYDFLKETLTRKHNDEVENWCRYDLDETYSVVVAWDIDMNKSNKNKLSVSVRERNTGYFTYNWVIVDKEYEIETNTNDIEIYSISKWLDSIYQNAIEWDFDVFADEYCNSVNY